MAFKFVILFAALAAANAGYLGAPAAVSYGVAPALGYGSNYAYGGAVGASHQSTLRSLDGNHVVSQYSKNVDTPFSSVRKTDTRVSNDAVAVASYAAPAVAYHGAAYAAPIASTYHGAGYAAPVAAAYHGAAYAAPLATAYHGAGYAAGYAAPLAAAYHGAAYHGAGYAAGYAAPLATAYHGAAYHGAGYAAGYAAPIASAYHGNAYGAAYGSNAVSHISFDGIGAHYAY